LLLLNLLVFRLPLPTAAARIITMLRHTLAVLDAAGPAAVPAAAAVSVTMPRRAAMLLQLLLLLLMPHAAARMPAATALQHCTRSILLLTNNSICCRCCTLQWQPVTSSCTVQPRQPVHAAAAHRRC
jgi:hypothetical protein